jgi:hypothetical protein
MIFFSYSSLPNSLLCPNNHYTKKQAKVKACIRNYFIQKQGAFANLAFLLQKPLAIKGVMFYRRFSITSFPFRLLHLLA